ncbi:DsrE family protein [Gynuella sunshinyii]|uniref:Uncharacterized protein involved in the oxidation of intracellular sulfur n=1 Tax=Gynuella sunshinyii YC6258 TaxID=1445510 RepID=A0A0C5VNC3_9GAMM|nr:DsrE family protein [Gynuella sunshinyii]AJQ95786.1 uncharacterized protein involved in the oxidation of intracellular sulfur [Gynuella sunshinyii YC6258]
MSDTFCFVFESDAFTSQVMDEGIDMAFAAAAFDQAVTVILTAKNSRLVHQHNQSQHRLIKKLKSLSMYGIEQLFVLDDTEELMPGWETIDADQYQQALNTANQVMVF